MLYGHRRDVEGYASALEEFDRQLPQILSLLGPEDLLLISADHGCDPTFRGTDHTREYAPLLAYGKWMTSPINLGTRQTFSDVAATIAHCFDAPQRFGAISFLNDLMEGK
ncbi:MAG TPA: phosphopentomutase, partial [Clostridiales bacterium]|nr:phosphopentomutase [Clostridiales bacterium]